MKSPDGICLDQEGAVWVAAFEEDAFIRLDANGRELQRIEVPGRRAIACALRRARAADTVLPERGDIPRRTPPTKSSARIDAVGVEIAGAGYP